MIADGCCDVYAGGCGDGDTGGFCTSCAFISDAVGGFCACAGDFGVGVVYVRIFTGVACDGGGVTVVPLVGGVSSRGGRTSGVDEETKDLFPGIPLGAAGLGGSESSSWSSFQILLMSLSISCSCFSVDGLAPPVLGCRARPVLAGLALDCLPLL